jgi:hypothetical protein
VSGCSSIAWHPVLDKGFKAESCPSLVLRIPRLEVDSPRRAPY